jgi:uncharacterized membrane protein
MALREILVQIIGFVVPVVEACGALVIVLGVGRTVVVYVLNFLKQECNEEVRALRIRLGQSMVMGLEFLVAADILKTSVSPTWEDILFLAALIGLRTLLNFLLEYELRLLNPQRASREPASISSDSSQND